MNRKIILFLIILALVFIIAGGMAYEYWRRGEINIMKNETEKFLGGRDRWGNIKMELKDVQGLNGGRDITVLGSGKTTVQIVRPEVVPATVVNPDVSYNLYQKNYEFTLEDSELNSLIGLFIENDFLTIDIKNRLGIPDEAHPKIILTNPDGKQHEVSVWSNDMGGSDPFVRRFANIYGRFMGIEMGIEANTDSLTPVSEGVWHW